MIADGIADSNNDIIEVKGLTKRYGRTLAVDNLSFRIRKGEVVGLLGPNGAGKTTTLKILAGFLSATSGRASIAGFDTFDASLQVREQIGYLPENCPLYLDLDVSAYLAFCAEVRGIAPKSRKAALDRVLSDCGLEAVRFKTIGHLSKGYRQRVGLAQALLHKPPVLILDEPTSGLDPNQIRDILQLITNLGQERTVIHSTHILAEVEATSDRVLIINRGRIVAEGAPRDLIARGSGPVVYLSVQGTDALGVLENASFVTSVDSVDSAESTDSLDSVETSGASDGFTRLVVRGHAGGDGQNMAIELYRLAVEKGWVLSELRVENAKLEDVFARLTRGIPQEVA